MSKRKTRERQLAKLAARRAAERRRKRRQRIVAGVVAFAVAVGGGTFAFVAFTGGKAKDGAGSTPTPSAKPGQQTGTVTPQRAPHKVACGAKAPPDAGKPKPQFAGPPPQTIDPSASITATMKTSCGTIEIELLPKRAPVTVNSFVFLARHHYFDGTYFHRLAGSIDVIQGGDPEGTGGEGPGYTIPDELTEHETYGPGTVAMANAGPGTGGSQFFIVTGPRGHGLDDNRTFTIFGRVVSGLDAARRIQRQKVGGKPGTDRSVDGRPDLAIYVDSVTVTLEKAKHTPKPKKPEKPKKPKASPSG